MEQYEVFFQNVQVGNIPAPARKKGSNDKGAKYKFQNIFDVHRRIRSHWDYTDLQHFKVLISAMLGYAGQKSYTAQAARK